MSSLDYLDLCRLCLVKDRVSVPIFDGEGDVRQIFLKIAACLPVKVAREDKLPKKICDDCVYKVELFYQFWNTTVNAEKQLLQWLGEVGMEGKQGYVTNVLNPNVMKQEQSTENRLDGSVMQQVSEHQNNMGIGMMDNIGLGIPMIISNTNQQQQITSVPMDTSSNSAQNVQAVPGPSSQTTHNQISQNQTSSTQQEEEEESSEDEENSDDECDGDEGLPVKEESEEDPNSRTIEPTTFVNVSLACDEAGPSGLQQQKIADMPEIPMPQTADGDPKSGMSTIGETSTTQNPPQPLFIERIGSFMDLDKMKIQIKTPPVSTDDDDSSVECDFESSSLVIEYKPRENISNIDNLRRGEMNYCSMSNRVNDSLISSKETTTFPRTEVGGNDCIPKIEEEHCVEPVLTPMMPVTDAETEQGTSMFDSIEVMDEIQLNTDGGVLTTKQYESGSEISFNPDAQQRDKKKKKGPCQPKAVRRILPKPTLYNSSESVGVNKKQSKREVPKRAKSKKGKVTRPRQKKQEGIPGTNVKEIYLTKGRPILPKPTVSNSSEVEQFDVQKTQEGIESMGLSKQQLKEISIVPIQTNSKEAKITRLPQFNVQIFNKGEITIVEKSDLQKTQEVIEGVGVNGKQLIKGRAILPKPIVCNRSEIEQFDVQNTQEGIESVGVAKKQFRKDLSVLPIRITNRRRHLRRYQLSNIQKKQEGIPSIDIDEILLTKGRPILPKPAIFNKERITIAEEFDLRKTQELVEGVGVNGKQLMKGTAILPKPTVFNSSEIGQFNVQKTQEGIESVGLNKQQLAEISIVPIRTNSKEKGIARIPQFNVQLSKKREITTVEELDLQKTQEIVEGVGVKGKQLMKGTAILPKPTVSNSSEIEQFNVQKTQEGIGSVGLSKQQLEVSIVPIQTNSKKRKLIRRQMFNVQKKQEGIPSINVGSSILPKPVISNKEEEEITIVEEFDLRKTQGVVEGADGKGKQLMKGTAILPKPTVSNSSEIEQFDVQKTQEGIESVGVAKKQSKRGRPKRTGSKRRKVTRPQQFSVQKEQKEIPSINIDEILLTKGRPILPKPTISNKEKITIAEEFDAQITREIIEFVNDEHLPKQRLIVPKPTINQSSEIIVIQDFYPHNMNMRMRPILPKPTSEPAPNRIGITSSSAIACPFCYRSYNKELSLEAHFRKWHRSHYLCKKCHYIYESQDALDEHYQVHAAPGMLQCSICKRRYKQLRRFEEHKTRYHTIKELETIYKSESIRLCACINKCPKPARSLLWKLTCKRCNNAFPQHSSLVALERPGDSIQNKVSNIVKCETCNKCFPSEDDLHLHAKLHERNFICNECGKEFREKFILRLHIRKHFD
ncbi:uncharacterized protein LOC143345562 isoform X1 [Colletes latitarsis]|uniref:uncharacterized protein LOC143345562 isoform X1 n=1 Tax=Colletes latitarsis TaxID=2605962 RepID=UPI004035C0D3